MQNCSALTDLSLLAISNNTRVLTTLDISQNKSIAMEALHTMAKYTLIKKLSLRKTNVTSSHLKQYLKHACPYIHTLDLQNCQYIDHSQLVAILLSYDCVSLNALNLENIPKLDTQGTTCHL